MKVWSGAALAALESNNAIVSGAVYIACSPTPVRVWGGYGPLTIGDEVFDGIGDRGLVNASGGGLGGQAQGVTLELSGVEPANLALLDAGALRNVPVVVWRLVFDGKGQDLLDAKVFTRGRLDQMPTEATPGGEAVIRAMIEGAARGLGRSRGRMRSDADQRLDDPDDHGLEAVSYAGQKVLYWGGKLPMTAGSTPGAGPSSDLHFDPF